MEKHLPDPNYFIGKEIPNLPGYKIVEKIGSGQNGHVFKAHSNIVHHDYACKIIPRENLKIGNEVSPRWKQEFEKPNSLNSPYVVRIHQYIDWIDSGSNINCVALISDYINGKSLKEHFSGGKNKVEIPFIEGFLKDMFILFDDMEQNGIIHGDLHDKNILIEIRKIFGKEYPEIRVTDFGVSTASYDTQLRDDYDQLGEILKSLLDKVKFQQLNLRDKFVFNRLNNEFLARHLTEKDITRNPLARKPGALNDRLEGLDTEYNKHKEQIKPDKLFSPFEYLNCEQIGESHDILKALYSNLFLGLQEIESRKNLVLTGPRGCGKSTVFKCLSLIHRTTINNANPEDIHYIGVYYRCDDLYTAFPRYHLPVQGELYYNIPIHYLTVTLIRDVLKSISMWVDLHFKEEFSRRESYISQLIWESIHHPRILKPLEPGADSFHVIISKLENERKRIQNKHIQLLYKNSEVKPENLFGPEVLIGVCDILAKNLFFIHDKPFYFFIDDYSTPKISEDLQRNLNRLFMQRTPVGFFKLSTESPVSYMRSDIDGKEYVEGREFTLVNLGLEYLGTNHEDKFRFLDDVFSRRFQSVENYHVKSLDQLIGDNKLPSNNDMARRIREGENEKDHEWGKQMVFELCSGDIFYIIELVGKMVLKSGGDQVVSKLERYPKIKQGIQEKAIQEEAGIFLDNLSRIEDGNKLVQVVTAFGNVANSYLKYKNSKNESKNPPYQACRIEPMEAPKLSPEAQKIYNSLLRYSLFIEDPRGKSIRGKVVPRLYLRRSLIPFFNLTFSTRDSLRLDNKGLEMLFINPDHFEKEKIVKKSTANNDTQRTLFGEIGEDDDYES